MSIFVTTNQSSDVTSEGAEAYEIRKQTARLKTLGKSATYADYELIEFEKEYILVSAEVNQLLGATALEVELLPHQFETDPSLYGWARLASSANGRAKAELFNSRKVRMLSDLTVEGIAERRKIAVEATDYFAGLCTNELAVCEIWSRRESRKLFDGFHLVSGQGVIHDLRHSPCSNHIGTSTLAVTSDGQVVVIVQPTNSAHNASRLSPSGSGSVDWDDFARSGGTFQQLLAGAMERELLEECELTGREGVRARTEVVGFARLLNRGGKPEFFGLSWLNIPFAELNIRSRQAMFIGDVSGGFNQTHTAGLKNAVHKFRQSHAGSMALQLYLNLQFLEDYLGGLVEGLRTTDE